MTLISEGVPRGEVTVVITDDQAIREMNREYRNKDCSTDVLSFAQRDCLPDEPLEQSPFGQDRLLGDVVISLETARRQADARGALLEEEVAELAVHGTLHLLGYDDGTVSGYEEMVAKQRAILSSLRLRG